MKAMKNSGKKKGRSKRVPAYSEAVLRYAAAVAARDSTKNGYPARAVKESRRWVVRDAPGYTRAQAEQDVMEAMGELGRDGDYQRNPQVRPKHPIQAGAPVRYQGNIYELTESTTGRKLVRIQRADMPHSIEGTQYVSTSDLKPATWAEYERAAKGASTRTPYEPRKKASKKPLQKKPSKNPYLGNHQITAFVGKLHVSTPDHEVWQAFYAAAKPRAGEWTPLQRRQIRSAVLAAHHANQKTYRAAMRGRF